LVSRAAACLGVTSRAFARDRSKNSNEFLLD